MSTKDELTECFTKQLGEIELLQSMYPNPGEIVLSESNITEINNFIQSKLDYVPNNLDIIINLIINEMKLEVCVNLPVLYPTELPNINIRCNQLNRQQETKLNLELSSYIKEHYVGEVCLYTVIDWLQEHIQTFKMSNEQPKTREKVLEFGDIQFCRMWIYSHHIYSKKKREDIVKLAKEYHLTGFCLSGKPGIICIEGTKEDCDQWWKIVKTMSWQKITVRKTEIDECSGRSSLRKFCNFRELHFNHAINPKQTVMSSFAKFMVENDFGQVFNELFGLDHLWNTQ